MTFLPVYLEPVFHENNKYFEQLTRFKTVKSPNVSLSFFRSDLSETCTDNFIFQKIKLNKIELNLVFS